MYAINDDIKLARTLAHSFTSNHRRIEFNDPMAKLKDLLHSFSTEGEGEREADENGLRRRDTRPQFPRRHENWYATTP